MKKPVRTVKSCSTLTIVKRLKTLVKLLNEGYKIESAVLMGVLSITLIDDAKKRRP